MKEGRAKHRAIPRTIARLPLLWGALVLSGHKLLCDANLLELHLFQSLGEGLSADTSAHSIKMRWTCKHVGFSLALDWRSVAASPFRVPRFRKSIGERGNNKRLAPPTSGGYAARKSPMWTGSWHACGEIPRNSAIDAARFLTKAMRPQVVRIATTSKDVTIEIMGGGATIEIIGQGLTTVRGPTMRKTNKVEDRLPPSQDQLAR